MFWKNLHVHVKYCNYYYISGYETRDAWIELFIYHFFGKGVKQLVLCVVSRT